MSKTIKINPELFKLGAKDKSKNKTIKNKSITKIAVNPNILKQKLIQKINQHKIPKWEWNVKSNRNK